MKIATLLMVGVALGLTACKPAGGEAEPPKVDKAAAEQAIRDKETGWMEAYNKRDAANLTDQFADDAVMASAGMAPMADAPSRKAFLDQLVADPALKVDFASDRIIVADSGELASSRGHYSFTYTDPATKKPKTEVGSYLTVYRKAADGSWKAVEDFVTPGPAAEAAATTAAAAPAADNASQ